MERTFHEKYGILRHPRVIYIGISILMALFDLRFISNAQSKYMNFMECSIWTIHDYSRNLKLCNGIISMPFHYWLFLNQFQYLRNWHNINWIQLYLFSYQLNPQSLFATIIFFFFIDLLQDVLQRIVFAKYTIINWLFSNEVIKNWSDVFFISLI